MLLRARVLSHPKRGNSAEENEDAHHWSSSDADVDLKKPFICAVADGATETSYSSLWAKLLVESFVECFGNETDFEVHLPQLRSQWNEKVHSKPLPWYAEEKAAKGAFATLLGLIVEATETQIQWRSIAVGDSCLFHVRDHKLLVAFPATEAAQLQERPMLLSSSPVAEGGFFSLAKTLKGELIPGDRLYLVTDAVAAWLFTNLGTDPHLFDQIDQVLRAAESFPEWLEALWEKRSLKNDDCTILRIEAVA